MYLNKDLSQASWLHSQGQDQTKWLFEYWSPLTTPHKQVYLSLIDFNKVVLSPVHHMYYSVIGSTALLVDGVAGEVYTFHTEDYEFRLVYSKEGVLTSLVAEDQKDFRMFTVWSAHHPSLFTLADVKYYAYSSSSSDPTVNSEYATARLFFGKDSRVSEYKNVLRVHWLTSLLNYGLEAVCLSAGTDHPFSLHHLDRNKKNNSFRNLKLMATLAHDRYHHRFYSQAYAIHLAKVASDYHRKVKHAKSLTSLTVWGMEELEETPLHKRLTGLAAPEFLLMDLSEQQHRARRARQPELTELEFLALNSVALTPDEFEASFNRTLPPFKLDDPRVQARLAELRAARGLADSGRPLEPSAPAPKQYHPQLDPIPALTEFVQKRKQLVAALAIGSRGGLENF